MAATAPAATGYAPAQQQAYAQQQAQLYAQQQQAQAYAQQAQHQQAQAYAQQAQQQQAQQAYAQQAKQQRYAAPPPLPTEARAAARGGGGSSSLVMVVVLLVIVAAGGYAYFTGALDKMLGKGGGLGKEGDTGTSASANPPPPTEAERKLQMEGCKAKGMPRATCELNPASGTVMGKCHEGYYGTDCTRRCRTGGARATVYTPGFAEGGGGEATCVCPSGSHFRNSDVVNGCELGDETGDACEAGWHGERCDKGGDFQSCQNGTQNASTGACDCTGGYQGKLCQYPSDWCTKTDSAATFDKATEKCVCSAGTTPGIAKYTGARCNQASLEAGTVISASGKAVDWKSTWNVLDSSSTVTIGGANMAVASCASCNERDRTENPTCNAPVKVCDLLRASSNNVNGCVTTDSLCSSGMVPTLDMTSVGGGKTCLLKSSCGGGWNNNNWFGYLEVPPGVQADVKDSNTCGSGSEMAMGSFHSPVTSSNGYNATTIGATHYQVSQDVNIQFKLQPGNAIKCTSSEGHTTFYHGYPTSSALLPGSAGKASGAVQLQSAG